MVQISGAILDDVKSINLGSVYESVVASELAAPWASAVLL